MNPTPLPRIGIFDSGIGGLSVLRALRGVLPRARLDYLADNAQGPYGERSDAQVLDRSMRAADFLHARGARMLVVACNTATAVAVDALRAAHPDVPVVGIEPGLKPAAALTRTGRVGVMATRATLRSARFVRLVEAHGRGLTLTVQACDGLAAAIEAEEASPAALAVSVERHCAPLRAAACDVVVLGCTHYPLAVPLISQALGPHVALVDTSAAVARQAARVAPPDCCVPGDACLRLQASGDPRVLLQCARRWLGAAPGAQDGTRTRMP